MFKKIIITIAILLVFVLGFAATKSSSFRIERKAEIKASPDKVFALISDFHKWDSWSPWNKLDPKAKVTFKGPGSGKGAILEWDGNSKIGKGRTEIDDVIRPSKIIIKEDIIKPFTAHHIVDFDLNANSKGNITTVTWSVYGSKSYVAKLMSVFVNCEKMIGQDLEEGLANLKVVAEKK